jgi:hypothetical protein
MSIKLNSVGGGSVTIQEPNTASDFTLSVPAQTANLLTNKTAGTVLQVVSTLKTDTFSTGSDSYTAITGLSASITPLSTSSKILIMLNVNWGAASNVWPGFRISRDGGSSFIAIGDAAGSRDRVTFGSGSVNTGNTYDDYRLFNSSAVILDSPSSASSLTYQTYSKGRSGYGSMYLNYGPSASDDDISGKRGVSSITLLEIAG